MQSIIQEALKNKEYEEEARKPNISDDETSDIFDTPKIVVIGCGGAGNNIINRLNTIKINGAEIIAIDTNKQQLDYIKADKKILIGKSITRRLDADGNPELGKKAAELAKGTLEELLDGADLVFITAGMGGGTGTGVAPVVASVAKEHGAIVVAIVTSPFRVERMQISKAEDGIESLRRTADSVIVIDNNRLIEYLPNLLIESAFSVMNQLIAETVKGITEIIKEPSLINIDYADFKTIVSKGGISIMLYGEGTGQAKLSDVVNAALSQPSLNVNYKNATGCLIHVTGGLNISLKEVEEIAKALIYELHDDANVIWGARIDENYEGRVRVMAIVTGVYSVQLLEKKQKEFMPTNKSKINIKRDPYGPDTMC